MTTSNISKSLTTYYETKLLKEFDKYPDYKEMVPKSKLNRLLIKLRLKPKKYRPVAKKGYVLRKDIFGATIQVPKELAAKDPTLKNFGKTITFTRYTSAD